MLGDAVARPFGPHEVHPDIPGDDLIGTLHRIVAAAARFRREAGKPRLAGAGVGKAFGAGLERRFGRSEGEEEKADHLKLSA